MATNEDRPDSSERTTVIIRTGRRTDTPDFEWLFTCWAWESGYQHWPDAVRALARALRGLERIGFIVRADSRGGDGKRLHAFTLTEEARDALQVFASVHKHPEAQSEGQKNGADNLRGV